MNPIVTPLQPHTSVVSRSSANSCKRRYGTFLCLSVCPDKLKGSLCFPDKTLLPLSGPAVADSSANLPLLGLRGGLSHPHVDVFEHLHCKYRQTSMF